MLWIPAHSYFEPMVKAFRQGSFICNGGILVDLINPGRITRQTFSWDPTGLKILRKDQDPEVETKQWHIHTCDVICLVVVDENRRSVNRDLLYFFDFPLPLVICSKFRETMEAVPIADGPRFAAITDDDHRGIVIIIASLFMVWMVLCLIIRSYIRIDIANRFSPDDYFIMAASVSIQRPFPLRFVRYFGHKTDD